MLAFKSRTFYNSSTGPRFATRKLFKICAEADLRPALIPLLLGISRTAARFTQADIARAIRAVEQTGAQMEVRVERDGTIRILPYSAPQTPANDTPGH